MCPTLLLLFGGGSQVYSETGGGGVFAAGNSRVMTPSVTSQVDVIRTGGFRCSINGTVSVVHARWVAGGRSRAVLAAVTACLLVNERRLLAK